MQFSSFASSHWHVFPRKTFRLVLSTIPDGRLGRKLRIKPVCNRFCWMSPYTANRSSSLEVPCAIGRAFRRVAGGCCRLSPQKNAAMGTQAKELNELLNRAFRAELFAGLRLIGAVVTYRSQIAPGDSNVGFTPNSMLEPVRYGSSGMLPAPRHKSSPNNIHPRRNSPSSHRDPLL